MLTVANVPRRELDGADRLRSPLLQRARHEGTDISGAFIAVYFYPALGSLPASKNRRRALSCLSALTYSFPSFAAASQRRSRSTAGRWKRIRRHLAPGPWRSILSFSLDPRIRRTTRPAGIGSAMCLEDAAGRSKSDVRGKRWNGSTATNKTPWYGALPDIARLTRWTRVRLRIANVIPAAQEALEDDCSRVRYSHQLRTDLVIHLVSFAGPVTFAALHPAHHLPLLPSSLLASPLLVSLRGRCSPPVALLSSLGR